jgi:SpoIIAA-like
MTRILGGFPENVVAVAGEGLVTRKDYQDVLVPAVTAALQRHDKVRLYHEIRPQFEGMEAGAMWEDFRVGMEHLTRWERVAVVTNIEWIGHTVNALRFLLPENVASLPGAQPALRERGSLRQLRSPRLPLPPTTVDIDDIRRRYHAEEQDEAKG